MDRFKLRTRNSSFLCSARRKPETATVDVEDDSLRRIVRYLLWSSEAVYILWLFLLPYTHREECAEGEECAAVLRAMLNVKSAEEKVEKGQSGRMSVVECLGKLSSSSSSSSSSLPAFVIEMDGSYIVDFKSIISVPRYHEMKAAVKRTYGEEFSQMFNYLLEKEDCLFETSEIVGAVGIKEEAALRGLFDMRKGGYMRMEKLLVRGVDMPILQWKIDTNFVIRTMLNIWYDASKLILLKKGHEIPPHIFPTEYELDDAIMIFHDY